MHKQAAIAYHGIAGNHWGSLLFFWLTPLLTLKNISITTESTLACVEVQTRRKARKHEREETRRLGEGGLMEEM